MCRFYLYNDFGSGWEWWLNFDRFHQTGIDELNSFDYKDYKANSFKTQYLGGCDCQFFDRPEGLPPVSLLCKR